MKQQQKELLLPHTISSSSCHTYLCNGSLKIENEIDGRKSNCITTPLLQIMNFLEMEKGRKIVPLIWGQRVPEIQLRKATNDASKKEQIAFSISQRSFNLIVRVCITLVVQCAQVGHKLVFMTMNTNTNPAIIFQRTFQGVLQGAKSFVV